MPKNVEELKTDFIHKLADVFFEASAPEDMRSDYLGHLQNILNRRTDIEDKGIDGTQELLDKAGLQALVKKIPADTDSKFNILDIIDNAMTIARVRIAPKP